MYPPFRAPSEACFDPAERNCHHEDKHELRAPSHTRKLSQSAPAPPAVHV
jgi:hypothetical protein